MLPTDRPYQLHPEEDKVASFVPFTHDEMATLWSETTITARDGRAVTILDSMVSRIFQPDAVKDAPTELSQEQEADMWKVMGNVGEALRQSEEDQIAGIIDEMNRLLEDTTAHAEVEAVQRHREHSSARYLGMKKVFSDFLARMEETHGTDTVVTVLDQSIEMMNFREEIKHAGKSNIESVTRVMYTLLDLKYPLDTYLEEMKKQPTLQRLAEQIQTFSNILPTPAGGHSETAPMFSRIGDALDAIYVQAEDDDEDPNKIVGKLFYYAFFEPDPEEKDRGASIVAERLEAVQNFLTEMGNTIREIAQDNKNIVSQDLSPLSEVRDMKICSLMQVAIPSKRGIDFLNVQTKDREQRRKMVFEARRVLIDLISFAPFAKEYASVVERGAERISLLWGKVLPQGDMIRSFILKKISPEHGVEVHEQIHEGAIDEAAGSQYLMRRFSAPSTETPTMVHVFDRKKSLPSYLRKALVRGFDSPNDINDVNARSLVASHIHPDGSQNEYALKAHSIFEVPVGKVFDPKGNQLTSIEDVPFVVDVIQEILKEAKSEGKTVRIREFKPTPKPGERIQSSGPGGGSDVRYAKFYVEYTQKNRQVIQEEVQIYTPTREEDGSIKSAFLWKQEKEDDDVKYTIERLLKNEGMRSFVELLWPYEIYGEVVRQYYNKHARKDAVRSMRERRSPTT